MKSILKIVGILLVLVAVAIGGLLTYIRIALPDVGGAPDLNIEATPERIERGRYLAHSVTVCLDCHSTRDWSKFSGPITPGTLGKGGDRFDERVGFPGIYFAKNITPSGIGRYTDGELYRVITTGVNKDGRSIFPVMPYLYYGKMDDEDVYSIIAFIRTLDPVPNEVPESTSNFPMNFIINTIPKKGSPTKRPDPSDLLANGAYLVNASGCIECHTQVDKGQIIESLAFSGGREFAFPDGSVVRSSNITPDAETGIGKLSKEEFIQRFKQYADSTYRVPDVKPGEYNSVMPWTMYAHMTEEDLSAIYAYLHTRKPVNNLVVKFSSAQNN
ncbi:MAG: c-type cytochrome [Cyclobacteriaceae bacterium]|nr:c-type cytochrome [Cyclobacteriaceae bacterium]